MKNKKKFISGLIMLVISVIFLFLLEFDVIGVEKLNATTIAVTSEKEEIIDVLTENTNENAVIYLGKINNNKITTLLNNSSNGIKLYYLDIENEKTALKYVDKKVIVKKDGSAYYKKLLQILNVFTEVYSLKNEYGEPINSGYKTIHTPFLIYLKDGKIIYTYYISDINNQNIQKNIINGFEKIK